ncbi:hypothetical protein [Mammaliicoccus sciuri]|uniref:hypothetical protein n=1 Tax=Mammaliicoccus sciuri TaxID=1296 RepID=UPI000E68E5BF|nr:hypothetical protein [Mammaliicoccus sciuri]RIN79458.1 hypothetical protein BU007_09185 [Mammaliicoccus sciuri]WQK75355.1 hypothetical protein P3U33_06410 [Mammaliicoccus sciuri]
MNKKYDYEKRDIEIAESNGISMDAFYQRLRYGWSASKARSYPVRNHNRNKNVIAADSYKSKKPKKDYSKPKPWLKKYPQKTEFGDYAKQLFNDCCGSW